MIKKHKKMLIIMITCVAIVTSAVIWLNWRIQKHTFETTDIEFYYHNSRMRDLLLLFPQEIPDGATAQYHYFRYYDSEDEYLELNFSSIDQLQTFVNAILNTVGQNRLVERINPYNSRYTEYHCDSYHVTSSPDGVQKNFQCIESHNERFFSINVHSMNVSEEDLTVIISYSNGKFDNKQYIPMYMRFFQVPLDENFYDYVEFPS